MPLTLKTLLLSAVMTIALIIAFGGRNAYASPTVVHCGAGTHAVVHHPIVDGRRIRRVTCERNVAVRRGIVGTTGTTTVNCGRGTHAVVRHPIVNGHRVRRVVCVR